MSGIVLIPETSDVASENSNTVTQTTNVVNLSSVKSITFAENHRKPKPDVEENPIVESYNARIVYEYVDDEVSYDIRYGPAEGEESCEVYKKQANGDFEEILKAFEKGGRVVVNTKPDVPEPEPEAPEEDEAPE